MAQTILVTGANSFIGGWIVKYLLEKGYNVRGTVRSQAKESQVLEGISKDHQSRISFVHISDITTDSFDEAVQGVDGIIHVASPFHFKVTDPEKDLLLPAINGTVRILQAAHEYNKNNQNKIKRVVITSSFASIIDPSKGLRPGYSYTEKDWSPLTYEQGAAAKNDPSQLIVHQKYVLNVLHGSLLKKKNPHLQLQLYVNRWFLVHVLSGFKSLDDINTSNASIWSLVTSGKDAKVPETRMPAEVDVRDVAYTHVAALEQIDRHE